MRVRATLRLRNHVALAAREQLGMTQAEIAKAVGCSQGQISDLENMRFRRIGEERIKVIADFYGVSVDDLAPPELRTRDKPFKATVVREVPLPTLLDFDASSPNLLLDDPIDVIDKHLDDEVVTTQLREALNILSHTQRDVISRYYGLDTDPERGFEVARDLGVSPARVIQIKNAALRKLRNHFDRKKTDRGRS